MLTSVAVWIQVMNERSPSLTHQGCNCIVGLRLASKLIWKIAQSKNVVVHKSNFGVMRDPLHIAVAIW